MSQMFKRTRRDNINMTEKLMLQKQIEGLYELKTEIQTKEELIKYLGEQQKEMTEYLKSFREEIKDDYKKLLNSI